MGFYMKNKCILFLFVAMTMLSVSFISCSSDDDSSSNGGGATSYAFQGKTYSGYNNGGYPCSIRFDSSGNRLAATDTINGELVPMSGTYIVNGTIIIVKWDNGNDTSFSYSTESDCIYWGGQRFTRQV